MRDGLDWLVVRVCRSWAYITAECSSLVIRTANPATTIAEATAAAGFLLARTRSWLDLSEDAGSLSCLEAIHSVR